MARRFVHLGRRVPGLFPLYSRTPRATWNRVSSSWRAAHMYNGIPCRTLHLFAAAFTGTAYCTRHAGGDYAPGDITDPTNDNAT